MKKLCLVWVCFLFLLSYDVIAGSSFDDMYKISCLPELKEFRAEVVSILKDDTDTNWLQKSKKAGLEKLDLKSDETFVANCVIDNIAYKMEFKRFYNEVDKYYFPIVVKIFSENKYLGVLYPLENFEEGYYDTVGIKDGKLFVQGCTVDGESKNYCKYNRREVDISEVTSYELNFLENDKSVSQLYNALEFKCYDGLYPDYGIVTIRSYNEETELPENYYWLNDNPVFVCGRVKMEFRANGDVIVQKDGDFFNHLNLSSCHKQVYELRFFPDEDNFMMQIAYGEEKTAYWFRKNCFEYDDCGQCEWFEQKEE